MELDISFHESAFKHEVTEADIRWAFKTFVFEEPIEGEEDKYLLIGYDLSGNPLEILFNETGGEFVLCFSCDEMPQAVAGDRKYLGEYYGSHNDRRRSEYP
ncbi:hypothetical protein [Treponema primitia]|uniref:hypothetical protein n=1 Tax=Treponema primitia TaxID=88058 RepID=UPI00025558C2|nr:hypothetical protein [Treponema primitia]